MADVKATKPLAAVETARESKDSSSTGQYQTSATGSSATKQQATDPLKPVGSAVDRKVPSDIGWMLKRIDKLHVLRDIRTQCERLSPYEMHLVLEPAQAQAAIQARLGAKVQWIESLRNALVVVPLMITWLSLGIAAAAYEQSLMAYAQPVAAAVSGPSAKAGSAAAKATAATAATPATPPPFFQLWQQGFPVLKSVAIGSWHVPLIVNNVRIFTFAEVAFADFLILASLFFLTLLAQGVELRAMRKAQRLYNWLENELYELGKISIAWALGPGKESKPRWATDVQEAMNALTGVMAQVENAVRRSVENFDSTVRSQENVVSQFRGETELVTRTVTELTNFYQRVKEIYEHLQETVPTITEQVTRLADTMAYGQDGNPEQLEEMVEQLAQLTGALQSIAVSQRRFSWGMFGASGYAQQPEAGRAQPMRSTGWFGSVRRRIGGWTRR